MTESRRHPGLASGPTTCIPPFNNKKARQALLYMVDQEMYLQAVIGQRKYYRDLSELSSCAAAAVRDDGVAARRASPTSSAPGSS